MISNFSWSDKFTSFSRYHLNQLSLNLASDYIFRSKNQEEYRQ